MATSEPLRTLVVDDEQLAREELCFLLGQVEAVEIVGQAADGIEALRLIEDQAPDVVLLDVQMPGLTGFEVARRILRAGLDTQLVFVTAYDRHAIEAFEVNAVDYLLKPVESARLATAIDRVRKRLRSARPATGLGSDPGNVRGADPGAGQSPDELERLLRLWSDRQGRRDQLAIKVAERFLLVQADEVVHASVEDDVITVVTNSLSGTSNYRTLDELQARLDPAVFWRVHRSYLVNIHRIKEVIPWFKSSFQIRMDDKKGTEIPVSRVQTKRLRSLLKL